MAMGNRKKAQEFLIENLEKILPGGGNKELYEKLLKSMSDEKFHAWMIDFREKRDRPVLYAPNFAKVSLNTQRNIDIAKSYGKSFFEKLWVYSKDGSSYLTNNEYMIVELPVRRQAQLLTKKISIPEYNRSIDQLTGQPSGDSRSSQISFMELQIMRSMGLKYSLQELIKFRGGDVGGFNAMNKIIARDGYVAQKSALPYATGVESTQALKIFLTCMHLKNTL